MPRDWNIARVHATAAVDEIRTESFRGREYTVVPVIGLVEQVLQGLNASSPEFAPASEFAKFPAGWDGRPVTMNHPRNASGQLCSANSPSILEDYQMGFLAGSYRDGNKLKFEAWIDNELCEDKGGEFLTTLEALQSGDIIVEVSTGLFTEVLEARGMHDGKKYTGIWNSVVPDHLAMLSEGTLGACSVADGCGAPRINSELRVHTTGSPGTATTTIETVGPLNLGRPPEACCDACAQGEPCMSGNQTFVPEAFAIAAFPDYVITANATNYADPGYQADAKERYPIDTPEHIRAAWSYINVKQNQEPYTSEHLDQVKGNIIDAWKRVIDKAGPPSAQTGTSTATKSMGANETSLDANASGTEVGGSNSEGGTDNQENRNGRQRNQGSDGRESGRSTSGEQSASVTEGSDALEGNSNPGEAEQLPQQVAAEILSNQRAARTLDRLAANAVDPSITFNDIRTVVQDELQENLDYNYVYVMAITTEQVVYCIQDWNSDEDGETYAINYSVDADGNVEFSGKPVPVSLLMRIVPDPDPDEEGAEQNPADNAAGGEASGANQQQEGNVDMAGENQNNTTEGADGEVTVNASGAEANSAPRTLESFLSEVPKDIRDVLQEGVDLRTQKRTQLVQAIVANSNGVYTEEDLKSRDMAELVKLNTLTAPREDYSGRAFPRNLQQGNPDTEITEVPRAPKAFERKRVQAGNGAS